MNSSSVSFFARRTRFFPLQSSSSSNCFFLSGPTPIHAPRPRPISYSVGVGTSDFVTASADASTQGGPPPLELSSFLEDLSLGAVSSPVMRASVSVLSPNFHRYLNASASPRSPPPPPRVTVDTAANAVVDCIDAAVDACVDTADKEVQAVIETADGSTSYEPQVETSLSASPPPPIADVPGAVDVDVDPSEVPSAGTTETQLEIPDDLSFHSPPSGVSAPGSIASTVAAADIETSPMGPSLLDSDDEPIASRLPG